MPAQDGKPYDVLVVEDDPGDQLLIEEALTAEGRLRSIVRAPDGLAALEHLRSAERHPDLIMLDLNMPRMGGAELLSILKTDDRLRVIPVVVLTTSSAPEDISDAYRRHANAYVIKPADFDEFTQAVQNIDTFYNAIAAQIPQD
ncbi:response regulator [Planotetraspora kaengkrachanensis]|uniref:Two-component system response regulator n=1 Tax=Planotetraspora kaengkrachanensis TaxID=575193 RepID=A0A8J3LT49_9ACTN|nr:response regulator [Planotetraspora kaengkrachanensis]GIG77692.1 two-component system response regulator [Planotetraspora kaengkrachanensis]